MCNKETQACFATEILITIYKAFLKHLIDYGDITHDHLEMNLFVKHYNSAV